VSLSHLLGSTCVITRRTAGTALDADGNLISTTTAGTTICSLQQTRRDEPSSEGEFSVTTWNLFLPTGTGIDTGDKVTVDGADYEMVGAPWDAREGSPDVWHLECSVKRTA
jgi:hypothetical protein